MLADGYEWGPAGRERFTRDFGVIETIERITPEDNASSKKTKKTVTIKRKPGASPLLFGKYLMDHCAFKSGGHFSRSPELPRRSSSGNHG